MSFTNDSVSGALPEQMNATHPKDFQGLRVGLSWYLETESQRKNKGCRGKKGQTLFCVCNVCLNYRG